MRNLKGMLIVFILVALFILVGVHGPGAQEKSTFEGKVIGIRMRLWLDVESQTDKALMNFRIGRKTVYNPHRYPNPGETVRVEYQIQRGIPVAFTVTVVQGTKDVSKEGAKEVPPESPKESEKEGSK